MKYVKIIPPILIIATALVGDYVIFKSKYSESHVFRAFSDSFIHASIGFLSSVSFFTHETNISTPAVLGNVAICTIISSLIDIDHVFVAKSFLLKVQLGGHSEETVEARFIKLELYLNGYTLLLPYLTRWIKLKPPLCSWCDSPRHQDMTNLKQRGIFHCTSFWLLITFLLLLYSYVTKKLQVYILTWMLILAYSSHHIRDGNRRGLWLYPFGHTPPLTKYLYVILVAILPYLFALLCKWCKPLIYKQTTVDYMVV